AGRSCEEEAGSSPLSMPHARHVGEGMRWRAYPVETQSAPSHWTRYLLREGLSRASAVEHAAQAASVVAEGADRSRHTSLIPGGPRDIPEQRGRHRQHWSPYGRRPVLVPRHASREAVFLT